jgi:hypothetical protein
MKVTLEINFSDLNKNFVKILSYLFENNIQEITLKRNFVSLEEFDKSIETEQIIESLKQHGHPENVLRKIEKELKNLVQDQK